jgi:hypothetical protein
MFAMEFRLSSACVFDCCRYTRSVFLDFRGDMELGFFSSGHMVGFQIYSILSALGILFLGYPSQYLLLLLYYLSIWPSLRSTTS